MAESHPSTLFYFGLHGKAEAIRMLLDHKGVNFTNRVLTGEEFGAMKAAGKFPAG